MKIDDMFKQYPENLIGFRVGGGIKIIDFWLDPNWQILDEHVPEDVKIKKQKVSEDTGFVYYIMFCEEKQFEDLFDMLVTIIEYNLDLQRKQDLFTEKMGELKGLFNELTYDELKQLSFDTPLSIISGKKKPKKTEHEPHEPQEPEVTNDTPKEEDVVLEEKTEN